MKVVCSYCRADMREVEPYDDQGVSHGICDECYVHFMRQWEGLKLGEYLDDFEFPVIVVTGNEKRIAAVNQRMAELIGKEEREVAGLLGGEALECVYSRLEGGCGKTIHCKTCTIRKTVNETWETGRSLEQVPARLDRDDGRIHLLISTYKHERAVTVVIEDIGDRP
jgi:PAS domain-containing protein